ncbi:MAG: hypothetical protein ACXW3E_01855 [Thermoanaerobaculia bacterium]
MRARFAIVAVTLLAAAVSGQTIAWEKFDPMAIRTTRTEPATLDVLTTGAVSALRLDYANGGSVTLSAGGGGRWSAAIPAAKLLDGYADDDVNHNFVGFLRLLGPSSETLTSYNTFIQVLDSRVPAVAIRDRGGNARATERILNLYRPGIGVNDVQTAAQQFYGYFHDDYDFLQVAFTIPNYPGNRYHFPVRNDVRGIGTSIFNNSAQYGSAGKLQGISVFPIDSFFDNATSAFSHELAHQWINYLDNASLQPGPHWPPSTMARGIMGFNIPGSNVGGDFPWLVSAVTSTTARTTSSVVTEEFDDFDLYLMGFIPPSAVAPGIIVQGNPCAGCVLPSTSLTIAGVIAANGPRSPDSSAAQKSFRIATVVITRDRLLNDDEMAVLEYFAARGEATTALPYTSGFARGTTKPFYLATRGIGHVDFRLAPQPRRRIARH